MILFPHNDAAFEAAKAMLAQTGRAAVIHPTGTGKSFIAFRFAEDDPERRVLWLGPSEYIYRTQAENLEATGTAVPENIAFCTYARLAFMEQAEMEALRPGLIILDEFHRCGAEVWGAGVARLLQRFGNVLLLGLSATHIRYLDGQRNMADELFGGSVASTMSLAEAIAAGILRAPRYVVGLYATEKELGRLEARVGRARNPAVRDEAGKRLEALRRALHQADGMERIFERHIASPTGRYLVFCTNFEQLRRVRALLPQWMCRVDPAPHIYTAYADDPETARAFKAFKTDTSDHLKLLCCIDMLNEGIHVDDVDGVVMVRPTVSPIIYKQQVGRALSASRKSGTPVIFDLVDNFRGLYGVGLLAGEIEEATALYEYAQEAKQVERFEIIDEVRECRLLFEALEDALTASWDLMFTQAEAWRRAHGNLDVPSGYFTPEGYSLGRWLVTQKRMHALGVLSAERTARLEALGVVWENAYEQAWLKYYRGAAAYYAKHGHLNIPARYADAEGRRLGSWIERLRQTRNGTIVRGVKLTPERLTALNSIGMVWDPVALRTTKFLEACEAWHREHGNLDMAWDQVTPDGLCLGRWLSRVRQMRNGKLSMPADIGPEVLERLDRLGMVWTPHRTRCWDEGYRHLLAFRQANGHCRAPKGYVCDDGFLLGSWTGNLRQRWPKLSAEQRAQLEALGYIHDKGDPWEYRYGLVRRYFDEHGTLIIPTVLTVDGVNLSKWVSDQRRNRREGRLSADQIARLEAMGMDWSPSSWEKCFRRFAAGEPVPQWVTRQRRDYREGRLTPEQIRRLEEAGMQWVPAGRRKKTED